MLVLARKREEQIVIGERIVITVLGIRRDGVRLGVDAPAEVPVHRREIYEAIQQQNAGKGGHPPGDQDHTVSSCPGDRSSAALNS